MEIQKVLVIDDDPCILQVAELCLERCFTTLVASSALRGLVLAELDQPDVILLDVCMPGISGPQALAMLKARELTSHIPVLLFTVAVMADELEQYRTLPIAGWIAKPFDPVALPRLIADKVNALRQCSWWFTCP